MRSPERSSKLTELFAARRWSAGAATQNRVLPSSRFERLYRSRRIVYAEHYVETPAKMRINFRKFGDAVAKRNDFDAVLRKLGGKIIPQIDERLAGIEYGRTCADYYAAAGCPARPRCRILPLRHYFECVAVVTFAGAGEFYAPSAALEEPDAYLRFE